MAVLAIGLISIGCASNPQTATQAPSVQNPEVTSGPITSETHFAAGQLAESQNNLPTAISQYTESLKLNPRHLASLYRLAVVYAAEKEFPQSIETWRKYVEATNFSATAYGDLGFCYEISGDSANAAKAYLAGIAKDPNNSPCRVNYGLMLARSGSLSEAVGQWRFVLSEAEIHYNLGSVYSQKGQKTLARAEFEKALQLDPNLTDAKARVSALDQ
jgi:tetratricopeptide (TPR) repeat protein